MRRQRIGAASAALGLIVVGSFGLASGNANRGAKGGEVEDIAKVRDKLVVLSTADGSYVALVPELENRHVYFGDRRSLSRQRVLLSATDEDDNFSVLIWAPSHQSDASVDLREERWTLRCGESTAELTEVGDEERDLVLKTAKFRRPQFRRVPYALARNQRGEYFYVDRDAASRGSEGFRFFSGRPGRVREHKLVWVVSDSEGDAFATRRGELRIGVDDGDSRMIEWRRGKARELLLPVPIGRNSYLIYKELGVYQNRQLGTPCEKR